MSKVRLKQLDQDEISGYVKQVTSGDFNNVSGSLTGLISSGSTMSGAFTSLNAKVDILSGQTTGISGRLDTIEQDFAAFGDQVDNFSGQVYSLSGAINSLSGDLNYFSGNLSTAESNISTLESDFLIQSGKIDTNSGNIITSSGALNTKINTISGVLDTVSGNEVITSGKVASISGSLNTLSGNFTGFTGRYVNDYVLVGEVSGSGVDGPQAVALSWNTRKVNSELSDDSSICSVSSNRITLSGGTYLCDIECPAYQVNYHRSRLWSISTGAHILSGTSSFAGNIANSTISVSRIKGKFTIPTGAILEIQHYCTAAGYLGLNTTGLSGENMYAMAEFRRIST